MMKLVLFFLSFLSFFAGQAYALPPTTVAELTAGISFADVGLGILAVAALLAAVYVTWRSVKFVIHAVKGM